MADHEQQLLSTEATAETAGSELVPYGSVQQQLSELGIAGTFDGAEEPIDGVVYEGEIVDEDTEPGRIEADRSRVVVPIKDVAFLGDVLTGVAFGRVGRDTWGTHANTTADTEQVPVAEEVPEVITVEAEVVSEPAAASTFERAYGKRIPNELMALTPPELWLERADIESALESQEYPEGSDGESVRERLEHVDRLLDHWQTVYETWSPAKRFGYRAKDAITDYMQVFLHEVMPRMYAAGMRVLNRAVYGSVAYQEANTAMKTHKAKLAHLEAETADSAAIAEEEELLEEAHRTRWQVSPARSQTADYVEERTRQVVEYSARALHNLTKRRTLS